MCCLSQWHSMAPFATITLSKSSSSGFFLEGGLWLDIIMDISNGCLPVVLFHSWLYCLILLHFPLYSNKLGTKTGSSETQIMCHFWLLCCAVPRTNFQEKQHEKMGHYMVMLQNCVINISVYFMCLLQIS